MRWKLWLSQQNNGRSLDRVLRIAGILCALWAVVAGYGLYSVQHTLRETRQTVRTQQNQTAELTRSLRQKQATAGQASVLHIGPPDSGGAAEWANEISGMVQQSQAKLVKLRIMSEGTAAGGANGQPTGGANAAPQANVTVNPASGTANVTAPLPAGTPNAAPVPVTGTAKDPDDGWKKVKLECMVTGPFPSLTALLNALAETPYIVEIDREEMARDSFDPHTGVLLLHLKLNLTLYGLPKKP